MSAKPHSIFISYRRADSVYAVDQLDERLKVAFGADAVFRDTSSIAPGEVFPESIRNALGAARVALVVIGPNWLRATTDPNDMHSRRRLDDPTDWRSGNLNPVILTTHAAITVAVRRRSSSRYPAARLEQPWQRTLLSLRSAHAWSSPVESAKAWSTPAMTFGVVSIIGGI